MNRLLIALLFFTTTALSAVDNPSEVLSSSSKEPTIEKNQPKKPMNPASISQLVNVDPVSDEVLVFGQKVLIPIDITMHKGWHIYWKNSGESGFPTQVSLNPSNGLSITKLHYPTPSVFETSDIASYGYKDSVRLWVECELDHDLKDPIVASSLTVRWLACSDSCIPGSSTHDVQIDPSKMVNQETFEAVLKSLPKEDAGIIPIDHCSMPALLLSKDLGEASIQAVYFYPYNSNFVPFTQSDVQVASPEEGMYHLITFPDLPKSALENRVTGVLKVEYQAKEGMAMTRAFEVDLNPIEGIVIPGVEGISSLLKGPCDIREDGDVISSMTPPSDQTSEPLSSDDDTWVDTIAAQNLTYTSALLFAFIGGMILNLMPCVLPVVSLKVFQLIQYSNESRRSSFMHGLVFALGIILSFIALACIAYLIRASGQTAGWGFHLQSPLFVAGLAFILFVLSLNLFGVFELGLSLARVQVNTSGSSHYMGSFLTGVLTTLVATPCTGPFLGVALGYSLTLSFIPMLFFFITLGFGLALPYLFLALFPEFLKWIPKPGPWMVTLKQSLGFLLLATVIWLVWVLNALVNGVDIVFILASGFFISLAGWIFGHFANPTRSKAVRSIGFALTLLFIGAGFYTGRIAIQEKEAIVSQGMVDLSTVSKQWLAFDDDLIMRLRAVDEPVFIDFTAKWCLICQMNKIPLHSEVIDSAFEKAGVHKVMADWTKYDPQITDLIHHLGRDGVPIYVLYPKGLNDDPIFLPQVLTKDIILEHIQENF